MNNLLSTLAPHSRVWVFQADRKLTEPEEHHIRHTMALFIPQWAAHGNELYGAFEVEEGYFLVVGVDEAKSPASGCSIDALTHTVKKIGTDLNIDFFNRLALTYVDESGKIQLVSMNEFKQKINANQITPDTIVFNNLVDTKAALLKNWKTQAKQSWHTNLFQLA